MKKIESDPEITRFGDFFWLVAAWVKSRAERPSVSGVNRQLHVQIGCKLGIRNRKDELTKQAKRNKLQIKPKTQGLETSCRSASVSSKRALCNASRRASGRKVHLP